MTDLIWRAKQVMIFTSPLAVTILVIMLAVLLLVRANTGGPSWWWVLAPLWGLAVYVPFLVYLLLEIRGLARL